MQQQDNFADLIYSKYQSSLGEAEKTKIKIADYLPFDNLSGSNKKEKKEKKTIQEIEDIDLVPVFDDPIPKWTPPKAKAEEDKRLVALKVEVSNLESDIFAMMEMKMKEVTERRFSGSSKASEEKELSQHSSKSSRTKKKESS